MKSSFQTNKILGKDWLRYHPYSNPTFIDNYYITLCNKVLKIIQETEISDFIDTAKEEKELACVLVSYFEDIISETHLFSAFTRRHKKMYGKELPFYEIPDEYYSDEINLQDIFFLIWYNISVNNEEIFIDPFFENCQEFNDAVLEIYNLFDSEFEKAPQNENLQNFLQLPANSDVKTIREKLSFIACDSFLYNTIFTVFFEEVLDEYRENDTIVFDKQRELESYDRKIKFIFNECMPLLAMRANEYYAEMLGEEHPEYQFIKNISKRIFGSFLLRKIESDGFLVEHLTSKKQLRISNEFTSLQIDKLVENETVLSIGLVEWKNNIWQNQGGCLVSTLEKMKEIGVSEHIFDDENKKKEFTYKFEKTFLEITKGKHIVYFRGKQALAEFYLKLMRKQAKIAKPKITDKELDELYKDTITNIKKDLPFENDETIGIFFNPNSGIEFYRGIVSCMPDKYNPYYADEIFDLCDLVTIETFSPEFVNYIIDNKLINLSVKDYKNPDLYNIMMKNLDFLLRFYRRSLYFSKPEVTINTDNT